MKDQELEELMFRAKNGLKIFVHKYKWSHTRRRLLCLRMKRRGDIKLIEKYRDGWLYQGIA